MSDSKYSENDPERTLITLDQLSQTIEVMTSVVNRLRQHLSQQIAAKQEVEQLQQAQKELQLESAVPESNVSKESKQQKERESMVVEITQTETTTDKKDDKTFH